MNRRLLFGSPIDELLERLYAQNVAQDDALAVYFTARAAEGSLDWNQFDERTNEFLRDKLIALDRAKAEFCYHVCRALRGGPHQGGLTYSDISRVQARGPDSDPGSRSRARLLAQSRSGPRRAYRSMRALYAGGRKNAHRTGPQLG